MPVKRTRAKKAAKKRRVRQNWCQMVIRVAVPLKDVKALKVEHVRALNSKNGWLHELEILNAYYDIAGHPDAMLRS